MSVMTLTTTQVPGETLSVSRRRGLVVLKATLLACLSSGSRRKSAAVAAGDLCSALESPERGENESSLEGQDPITPSDDPHLEEVPVSRVRVSWRWT